MKKLPKQQDMVSDQQKKGGNKMIKLQLKEIVQVHSGGQIGIHNAIVKLGQADVPIKTSYRISKLINKIKSELVIFNDKRNDIIKKFGELTGEKRQGEEIKEIKPMIAEKDSSGKDILDEEGNPVMVSNPKFAKAQKEFEKLFEVETEIDFDPIEIECLEGAKLSGFDLDALEKFIKA